MDVNQNKQFISKIYLLFFCLPLLVLSSTSYAQIYKWVDENGQTHYSDNIKDVGKSKVEEVKLKTSMNLMKGSGKPIPNRRVKELELKLQQAENQIQRQKQKGAAKWQKPEWGGNQPESDKTRCALARDIISGRAVHMNGVKTDSSVKEIAKNDVKEFCH